MAANLPTLCKAVAVTCLLALATACKGGTVWTDAQTKTMSLGATSLKALEVTTHNGSIDFVGKSEEKPTVIVTKKAGADTVDGAAEALAAVEVFIEPAGDDGTRIGWRWKTPKRDDWQASVAFDITASPDLYLHAESHNGAITAANVNRGVKADTHNGAITITKATGDVLADTHNGNVTTQSAGGTLRVDTHNGEIDATYAGSDLELGTHNGSITANLAECRSVGGVIDTNTGSIELIVGAETTFQVKATTDLGAIECSVPLAGGKTARGAISGSLGEGKSKLRLNTKLGSITIRTAD